MHVLTGYHCCWGGAVDNSFPKDVTLANNFATSYVAALNLFHAPQLLVSNN